jgi:hypothetical protein
VAGAGPGVEVVGAWAVDEGEAGVVVPDSATIIHT